MRRFRRTNHTIRTSRITGPIMWNNLSADQQETARNTFYWIQDRMTNEQYQTWLETGGFYFSGSIMEVSNVYHAAPAPQRAEAEKEG